MLGVPDPIEAIKFRMEQMNLRQADIAPLFGGKTRVSEVLHRKRPLTLKMITLLYRYLGIPLESLVAGNKEIKLEDEKLPDRFYNDPLPDGPNKGAKLDLKQTMEHYRHLRGWDENMVPYYGKLKGLGIEQYSVVPPLGG